MTVCVDLDRKSGLDDILVLRDGGSFISGDYTRYWKVGTTYKR